MWPNDHWLRQQYSRKWVKRRVWQAQNESEFDLQVDDSILLFRSRLKVQRPPRSRSSKTVIISGAIILSEIIVYRWPLSSEIVEAETWMSVIRSKWHWRVLQIIEISSVSQFSSFYSPTEIFEKCRTSFLPTRFISPDVCNCYYVCNKCNQQEYL